MNPKILSLGLIFIMSISCKSIDKTKRFERSFIESYTKVDEKCLENIVDLLKPLELEGDGFRIKEIYRLNVELDTNIYSKGDLLYKCFIGIVFEPDSFDLLIMCVDYGIGAIEYCQIIDNDQLVLNNMSLLFTDLSTLGNYSCLDIGKSLVDHTKGNKTIYRSVAWSSTFYGKWKPVLNGSNGLAEELFNNNWIFKKEDDFFVTNEKGDTLLSDKFDLQGESILITGRDNIFDIMTFTHKAFVIKDQKSNNYLYFNKEK